MNEIQRLVWMISALVFMGFTEFGVDISKLYVISYLILIPWAAYNFADLVNPWNKYNE